jgi:hypothetical protein
MNWDAIGAIGQAVSALALLFVLVQLRHAREEMRRSVSRARADVGRELWMIRADNPQLSGLLTRTEVALSGQHSSFMAELAVKANITSDEASQLFSHQYAWWIYQAQVIPFAKDLRAGERVQFNNGIRAMYKNLHLGRLWYQIHKSILDPDAVRYVDNLLMQSD